MLLCLVLTGILTACGKKTNKTESEEASTSIKDADRIYIIEHGEIVGVGTHKQLLKNNEVYKEIYASQTRSK